MVTTTTPQTTPPEIKEVPEYINVESEVYEPSAAVRIQRVLYRLDSGEQLASGYLKHRDNFCVLGLFADESGMGDWTGRVKGSPRRYWLPCRFGRRKTQTSPNFQVVWSDG